MLGERTSQLQELRKQLSTRDRELCELRREREREAGGETERLQGVLKEKEAFIKVRQQFLLEQHPPVTAPCLSKYI